MAQIEIDKAYDLLLIGGSAGSLEVLLQLLPLLRTDLDLAIIIVLHRKNGESILAGLLNGRISWEVKEAEEKEPIKKSTVYIAPADYHLLIELDHSISLDASEKIHFSRPAIDVTFETAAEAYGNRVAALLLSGANSDGAAGLAQIKKGGGLTLVQNPEQALVSFMPQQALNATEVDFVGGVTELVEYINRLNKKE